MTPNEAFGRRTIARDLDGATLDARRALVDIRVTLDGAPAAIMGARNAFATVRTLDGRTSAEWSWETVRRIVDNGGAFRF